MWKLQTKVDDELVSTPFLIIANNASVAQNYANQRPHFHFLLKRKGGAKG